jgi:pimeloyl-ACP methyl ester carboxylesterase
MTSNESDRMYPTYTALPERRFIDLGTTRLAHYVWGVGKHDMLLLHGITSNAALWWRVAPTLAEQGYRVHAIDMPGHGASGETHDHRIAAIAAMVGEASAALGLRDLVLIGHSWGGATALALASGEHPARHQLRAVALLDPALGMNPEIGARLLGHYTAGLGEPAESCREELRAEYPAWAEGDIYWKSLALQDCRRSAVEGLFVRSGNWSLIARISEVQVPLLMLLADDQHTVVPASARAEVADAVSAIGGELRSITGASHSLHRDAFAATMDVLTTWLKRV